MRGFTLLFSIMIMSLLFAIAAAIVQTSSKQLVISNIGRDSQKAFYASDSGIECARYLDKVKQAFSEEGVDPESLLVCGNNTITINQITDGYDGECPEAQQDPGPDKCVRYDFSFDIGENTPQAHTDVRVYRNILIGQMTIQSFGYNNNDLNSSRRLERALESTYIN